MQNVEYTERLKFYAIIIAPYFNFHDHIITSSGMKLLARFVRRLDFTLENPVILLI